MAGDVTPLSCMVPLPEPVLRLAQILAGRYDLAVPQLVEVLLLGVASEHEDPVATDAAAFRNIGKRPRPGANMRRSQGRDRGRVIPFDPARRRTARAPAVTHGPDAWRARVDNLVRRAQALRRQSDAIVSLAQRARLLARQITGCKTA